MRNNLYFEAEIIGTKVPVQEENVSTHTQIHEVELFQVNCTFLFGHGINDSLKENAHAVSRHVHDGDNTTEYNSF